MGRQETIGVPLVEAYGMTEAAHQMASNPLPPRERRAGAVGPGTGTGVVTLDDDWRPVRPGEEGEVAVRVKELINRAGEKISPYEVEDVLLTHPAAAEAAACPVPDSTYGEQVGVVIVLRGEAAPRELTSYCAERLAAFKRPVRVTILDAIPKGPTGKIQRRNLAGLDGGGS